jgi:hypothetical protein
MAPGDFADERPVFDPIVFFTGPTHSWGVLETRSGEPRSRFRTEMEGVPEGRDVVVVTQDFTFESGRTDQRVWRIERTGPHRIEATAADVVGVAHGDLHGNAFRWEYTLELRPGNALSRVRMHHWMYLADDGQTVLNQVTITKLGVRVGGTTEYLKRGPGPGVMRGPGPGGDP